MSIESRLKSLFLRFIVPLMVLMGALFYLFVKFQLEERMDDGLLIRAQALAGMVVVHDGHFELDFSDASMPQYREGATDEYFEVFQLQRNAAGPVIERSDSLGENSIDLGPTLETVDAMIAGSFRWNAMLPSGKSGRCLALRHVPVPDEGTTDGNASPQATEPPYGETLLIVIAQSREELDGILNLLKGALAVSVLLLIGCTLLAVRMALGRGLAPLADLAANIESIGPADLARRIPSTDLPQELTPIAERTNQLLDRLSVAFDREKRLAASAAHEMRTPIAELRAVTELALSRERDAADYRRMLESVLDTTKRMGSAADAVLRLARVQAGRESPALESIDLGEAVRPIWSRLIEPLIPRGIRASFEIDRGVLVRADRAMLEVIFENLCVNAAGHAPVGGDVRVHCDDGDPGRVRCVFGNAVAPAETAGRRGEALHVGLGLLIAGSMCEVIGGALAASQTDSRFTVAVELKLA